MLSPSFSYYQTESNRIYEDSTREDMTTKGHEQGYGVSIASGIEYFFSLSNKQLSLKANTVLFRYSRTDKETHRSDGYYDYYRTSSSMNFYFPLQGSVNTYLSFHF